MHKLQEATDGSDYRCTSNGKSGAGQCQFLSMHGLVVEGSNPFEHELDLVEGIDRCPAHGGGAAVEKARKDRMSVYKIELLQERITEQIKSGQIKDLRNEVALSRIVTEEIVNKAVGMEQGVAYGLELYQPKIERMLGRTESLISSCQRIEDKAESQLDVTQANAFAANLMKIAMKYVPEDKQTAFADDIERLLF